MFKRLRRRNTAPRHAGGSVSMPGSRLPVCPHCRADHVYPVEWWEAGDEHWWMLLRCGECAVEREVTLGDDVAKRYDADLDAAKRAIDEAGRRLDRERMAGETEIFVEALKRDLIDAGDFARRIG